MGREFELKYKASPEILRSVSEQWSDWAVFSMETTYFDTADHILSSQNRTLRCRMENGEAVCTIKTPISGYGRGEWDVHQPWSEAAVLELFTAAGIHPIPFSALSPICGARFIRKAKTLILPECTVEIALDEGVLMGGNKEIPLYEAEVELKSGSEQAAVQWATLFAAKNSLQPERKSKFRRALDLTKEG